MTYEVTRNVVQRVERQAIYRCKADKIFNLTRLFQSAYGHFYGAYGTALISGLNWNFKD